MDSIDPRITNRLNVARSFAYPNQTPPAPDLSAFPSLGDTVWITPPVQLAMTDQEMAAFFEKLRNARQDASLRRAQQGGKPRPTDPEKEKDKTGPLDIKAHGYYEGDKLVPVREIRVFEVNDYRKRDYQSFAGGWPDSSMRMDNARVGKYYRVKVTWESGATQERDVRMDSPNGTSVDVWKY